MVKLRGVNVFPEAIGALVVQDERTNGEHFIFVDRIGEAQKDEMTVLVEVPSESFGPAVKLDLERRLKEALGVRMTVEIHPKGALDQYTGSSQTTKIKRLRDRRKQAS